MRVLHSSVWCIHYVFEHGFSDMVLLHLYAHMHLIYLDNFIEGYPFFTLRNKLITNLCLIGGTGLVVLAMYTGIYRVNLLLCLHSKWNHMLLAK